jgi:hypothetical protein
MQKLNEQLENIKGRASRQSKSSKEKLNELANERQRPTVGDYKLETIHEIHDEIADPERISKFISESDDSHTVGPVLLKRDSYDEKSGKKGTNHLSTKFYDMSIISPKNYNKDDRNLKYSQNIKTNAAFRTVSEYAQLDRNKVADDTLHCSLKSRSGQIVTFICSRKFCPCRPAVPYSSYNDLLIRDS